MKTIDLRSDTLTLPTKKMLSTMAAAPVGDDGRSRAGKSEDPSAILAQTYAAALLHKQDALFVPYGTLGNTLSVLTHCPRGSKIIVADNMHLYRAEKAVFDPEIGGMQAVLVKQRNGLYDLNALKTALSSNEIRLVCLENSYNFEGGRALRAESINEIAALCHSFGVPVHLDGARIFNAAAALKTAPDRLCAEADSVMFCVSKGLCAPIGSFVAGRTDWILAARKKRKLLGGQLRQVGLLAAGGEYALRHLRGRLCTDNRNAFILAQLLADCPGIRVDLSSVMTNIVMVFLPSSCNAQDWIDRLDSEQKVLAHYIREDAVRFVTYRGISEADVREAARRVRIFCEKETGGR